jgi:hypothetical protein
MRGVRRLLYLHFAIALFLRELRKEIRTSRRRLEVM